LIKDDGKHDDADNDKKGDVLSPRDICGRRLRKLNEHEEFNDDEHEKNLERVNIQQNQNKDGSKSQRQ
jgi:hypothetical protein